MFELDPIRPTIADNAAFSALANTCGSDATTKSPRPLMDACHISSSAVSVLLTGTVHGRVPSLIPW